MVSKLYQGQRNIDVKFVFASRDAPDQVTGCVEECGDTEKGWLQ